MRNRTTVPADAVVARSLVTLTASDLASASPGTTSRGQASFVLGSSDAGDATTTIEADVAPDVSASSNDHVPASESLLTSEERQLYEDHMRHHGGEPEDAILVASGVLPKLLVQAKRVPPSRDWKSHLDSL